VGAVLVLMLLMLMLLMLMLEMVLTRHRNCGAVHAFVLRSKDPLALSLPVSSFR
jgi:hypothetical protein